MDILPIQASSVPCERVFSSAKETMTPCRNHISTKMMEALQILKYSLRYGRDLNFTEGLNWGDELTKMESSHRVHLHIPEHLLLILVMLPLILTLMLMIVFNYILNMLSYCRSALPLNKYIVLAKLLKLVISRGLSHSRTASSHR